jgi:ubiquinone/menaquinone biosynthesis C-methylase UbiE/DNA-binding HxlR family transcriptional regulator
MRYSYMFASDYMNTLSKSILDHLSALGDETRMRILALLEQSELTVSELCTVLQIPQPNVSRHLKTLTSEGWLQARADGRSRHYRLSPTLDRTAADLWALVRTEVAGQGIYAVDAERAATVLDVRRRRSAAFFADAAERWDDIRTELFGHSASFALLLGLLNPDSVVGDLGVGTGAFSEMLAPFVCHVVGIDRSAEMLEAAKLRLEGVDNVDLRQGDLEKLPVEDCELDVAVLALVLHYVVDPALVFAEVHRALKPGGQVIAVDMRAHERGHGYAEEMGHVWSGFELEQVEHWLADAGFEASRTLPLRPDPVASGPLLFLASAVRSSHNSLDRY